MSNDYKMSMHNPNWAPRPRRGINTQGLFPISDQPVDEVALAKSRLESSLAKSRVRLQNVDTEEERIAKARSSARAKIDTAYEEACEVVKSFVGA